ncbi:APC family permease [Agrococcus terreus]|uniref:Amino acid transporter n=1 Tax=Agrococcus terreus TaxID=574649 RepID=A0ABQ2KEY3_9MICO|nr:APC family permease [Agrococcus terreus]GGN80490.1 amino acid transporter [Agrococcus terreus]
MAQLERRIGVPGAIAIGLGAMIGAGLFFVWAPASATAGGLLPLALVLAGAVAVLNALSTAQLAMEHPVSGGAYAYGRAEAGERVGFAAGWMFLTGKTASAAAIAVVAGRHLWPEHAVPVAVAAVLVLAALNMAGIRVTAWTSAGIVAVVLVAVVAALVWWAGGGAAHEVGWIAYAPLAAGSTDVAFIGGQLPGVRPFDLPVPEGALAVLQAAGLLFFAFAGYARMATLGEEVRDPRRTLPIAIVAGLAVVLVLYALVAWATSDALGALLPISGTPVADLVADPVLRGAVLVAGGLACLGSLMGILAGLSRTSLAMAREGDLPGPLSRIAARTATPIVAEAAVAVVAIIGVLLLPPGGLVAVSSTCVLTYYAIAHLSAIRMRGHGRAAMWLPRWLPVAGLGACALLVVTLPWPGVLAAAAWLALGLGARELLRRRR